MPQIACRIALWRQACRGCFAANAALRKDFAIR
jgi:hypothetical protein